MSDGSIPLSNEGVSPMSESVSPQPTFINTMHKNQTTLMTQSGHATRPDIIYYMKGSHVPNSGVQTKNYPRPGTAKLSKKIPNMLAASAKGYQKSQTLQTGNAISKDYSSDSHVSRTDSIFDSSAESGPFLDSRTSGMYIPDSVLCIKDPIEIPPSPPIRSKDEIFNIEDYKKIDEMAWKVSFTIFCR